MCEENASQQRNGNEFYKSLTNHRKSGLIRESLWSVKMLTQNLSKGKRKSVSIQKPKVLQIARGWSVGGRSRVLKASLEVTVPTFPYSEVP